MAVLLTYLDKETLKAFCFCIIAYYFLEVGAADRDIVHLVELVLAEAKCDR